MRPASVFKVVLQGMARMERGEVHAETAPRECVAFWADSWGRIACPIPMTASHPQRVLHPVVHARNSVRMESHHRRDRNLSAAAGKSLLL